MSDTNLHQENPNIGDPSKRSFMISCFLPAAIICILTFTTYSFMFRAGYIWDDETYITGNKLLHSVDGLKKMWTVLGATPQYYPLVFTTFWLDYQLWGDNAVGYHVINIILHSIGAILLWIILKRLAVPAAWFAAALFAIHPVHVETVAWITERKNVLSAVFYFSALLAYMRFAKLDGKPSLAGRSWTAYALALVFFLAALLSKTVTSTLPAAILLLIWWKRERIRRKDVIPLIPMFVLGFALGNVTAWMERHHVGATGSDWDLNAIERGLIAGRALWFYVGKLVWPANLMFNYPRWHIDAGQWWQYLYPLSALAAIAALWLLRHRTGRSSLVAVLFFCGTLSPALGFFDVYPMRFSFVADHFQYLASIGIIVLLASLITKWACAANRRPVVFIVHGLILCVLGVLTWRQTHIYKNIETLWTDTLAKNPDSWIAHNWVGDILMEKGRIDEALSHYEFSAARRPDLTLTCNALAKGYSAANRLDDAIVYYQKVVELTPEDPNARDILASHLILVNRCDEAIQHLERALRLDSNRYNTHFFMGMAYARKKEYNIAIRHYLRAMELNRTRADLYFSLGESYVGLKDYSSAQAMLQHAIKLDPWFLPAYTVLADTYSLTGQKEKAITIVRELVDMARKRNDPELVEQAEQVMTRFQTP